MKKIAIINGSPKGNSSFTLRIAKMVAKKLGCEEPIEIDLQKYSFAGCTGCMKCFKTDKCIINDDIYKILSIIEETEIIIFATPVFFFSVSYLMKHFIDRLITWGYKSKQLFGKYAIAVTTADGAGSNKVSKYLGDFCSFLGIMYLGNAFCYISEFDTYKKPKSRFQNKMNKLINNVEKVLKTGIYRLRFADYYNFGLRKRIITIGRKKYSYEYKLWEENNYLKMDYYKTNHKLKRNWFKKKLADIATKIVVRKHK
ncbi:MAG: hypothetical protein A2086_08255 [Spirochaetes bacterium GWD1_27_9]|nr:MAG: hypothetical protein A2Z98_01800 [Spirochaetes bacterium GWB1_27_13]OHD34511.1 MAG: hypothetical protein A2086_08255 [Spirochaetes bacterium GWD1_27_9]